MNPVAIVSVLAAIARPLYYVLSDQLAVSFLFGGPVQGVHKTKFAVEKLVERYAESINALNRAVMLSVAFVPIAILPSGPTITIPFIDLSVARQDWLRVCPAISYGLQMFTLVALCWFMLLRRGLDVLRKHLPEADHFGEVKNLMLTGVVGSLWIVMSLRTHFPSKWHLLWFVPVACLLLLVVFSPAILCAYFVAALWFTSDVIPAILYSALLVPSVALAIVLLAVSVIEGMKEAFVEFAGWTSILTSAEGTRER